MDDDASIEPPAKKQKTAPQPSASLTKIIKLTVSPDNKHTIAVTDDKCVHVFEIDSDGTFQQLSQRFMPKRLCAIRILPDNATILCGDKFGDVYSLPLVPEVDEGLSPFEQGAESKDESSKAFKPSASNLTVHTQRNRKALEAQMQQKNLSAKTKEPLRFEHKLLLGHVSLLTDVVYATQPVGDKHRGYIITADRDEHIRVSRGSPQSHVIEGYCLGHREFISSLCLVPNTELLLSGGGDDWVGVWHWPTYKLRRKLGSLKELMCKNSQHPSPVNGTDTEPLALSGIWIVPGCIDGRDTNIVALACERIPALAFLPVSGLLKDTTEYPRWMVKHFLCPILDIACIGAAIVVSFDDRSTGGMRLGAYRLKGSDPTSIELKEDHNVTAKLRKTNNAAMEAFSADALDAFLYTTAKLRKRGNQEDADGD